MPYSKVQPKQRRNNHASQYGFSAFLTEYVFSVVIIQAALGIRQFIHDSRRKKKKKKKKQQQQKKKKKQP